MDLRLALLTALLMVSLRSEGSALPAGVELGFRVTVGETGKTNRLSRTISAKDMKSVTVVEDGGVTKMVWKGGNDEFGRNFEAVATLKRIGDEIEYGFSFKGNESKLPLCEVWFPVIEVKRTDRTSVLYPDSTGVLFHPDWKSLKPGKEIAYARPRSFHFIATIDRENGGWYVDQRGDARSWTTYFKAFNGEKPDCVAMAAVCETPAVAVGEFSLPFPGVIASLRGNWFAAAKRYREWAWRQPWYAKAKARDLGPLRDISMWFWNRGASGYVLPAVEKFIAETGVKCALDWYWWHDIPYDMCFPNFWPPREGVDGFRRGIARCKELGVFVQPYVNGMTWDMDDPSWTEGGEEGVRHTINGIARAYAFNRFSEHRLAYMCGNALKYQAKMRDICRKLVDAGMPGIYLDMIGHSSYEPCYATGHGHVPGGGTFSVNGNRNFVAAVRKDCPGVRLATEEASESYLEDFDSGICLNFCYERFGYGDDRRQFLPVAMAVYHGMAALFGSFAMVHNLPAFDPKWPADRKWKVEKDWVSMFPDQFAVEFTRGVVWGIQPTVHNYRPEDLDNPRFAADWKLMADTARFYGENLAYLFDGQMLDPGDMKCDGVSADFLIRSTYAREGEYKVCHRTNLPSIFHAVWQSPDGRKAVIMCNWTRETRHYRLQTPDVDVEGSIAARSWVKKEFK
ncbi:MAG: DUF6259 domain-containing protein [Bacteroidales bacterium]|nr:DUF6259 domain-containing protein [Bacteroidales bacterium]